MISVNISSTWQYVIKSTRHWLAFRNFGLRPKLMELGRCLRVLEDAATIVQPSSTILR
jgi:hypothetical protein